MSITRRCNFGIMFTGEVLSDLILKRQAETREYQLMPLCLRKRAKCTEQTDLVLHDHVADHGEEVLAVEGQRLHVPVEVVQGLLHPNGALK
jgi:hypothetical protein